MKYIIDSNTNLWFLQIIGLTETSKQMEYPIAFQIRNQPGLVDRIIEVLEECFEKITSIERKYHYVNATKEEYEYGVSVFRGGDIPVMALVKERGISLMIGSKVLGEGYLNSPNNLLHALKEEQKKEEALYKAEVLE